MREEERGEQKRIKLTNISHEQATRVNQILIDNILRGAVSKLSSVATAWMEMQQLHLLQPEETGISNRSNTGGKERGEEPQASQ
jgi:hypothetical protein